MPIDKLKTSEIQKDDKGWSRRNIFLNSIWEVKTVEKNITIENNKQKLEAIKESIEIEVTNFDEFKKKATKEGAKYPLLKSLRNNEEIQEQIKQTFKNEPNFTFIFLQYRESPEAPSKDLEKETRPEKQKSKKLEGKTFIIEPWHGSADPWALGFVQFGAKEKKQKIAIYEAPVVMDVALRLVREIRAHGGNVVLTHYAHTRGIVDSDTENYLPRVSETNGKYQDARTGEIVLWPKGYITQPQSATFENTNVGSKKGNNTKKVIRDTVRTKYPNAIFLSLHTDIGNAKNKSFEVIYNTEKSKEYADYLFKNGLWYWVKTEKGKRIRSGQVEQRVTEGKSPYREAKWINKTRERIFNDKGKSFLYDEEVNNRLTYRTNLMLVNDNDSNRKENINLLIELGILQGEMQGRKLRSGSGRQDLAEMIANAMTGESQKPSEWWWDKFKKRLSKESPEKQPAKTPSPENPSTKKETSTTLEKLPENGLTRVLEKANSLPSKPDTKFKEHLQNAEKLLNQKMRKTLRGTAYETKKQQYKAYLKDPNFLSLLVKESGLQMKNNNEKLLCCKQE